MERAGAAVEHERQMQVSKGVGMLLLLLLLLFSPTLGAKKKCLRRLKESRARPLVLNPYA